MADDHFNGFHGHHRQIYVDIDRRKVDVFAGGLCMCHEVAVAERHDRGPFTVPLAELLLTKLQIVELNERVERDVYNLCFHPEMADGEEPGIESGLIAELCARDCGL